MLDRRSTPADWLRNLLGGLPGSGQVAKPRLLVVPPRKGARGSGRQLLFAAGYLPCRFETTLLVPRGQGVRRELAALRTHAGADTDIYNDAGAAIQLLQRLRPAVVYACSLDAVNISGAARALAIPAVLHLDDPASYVKEWLQRIAAVDLIRAAHIFITGSREIERLLADSLGPGRPLVKFIPPFVSRAQLVCQAEAIAHDEVLREIQAAQGETIVAGMGDCSLRSGTDLFVDAHRILTRESARRYRFVWIGDELQHTDERLVDNMLSAEPECVFLGEKANPYPYLQAAQLVVMPARETDLPFGALEAIALGKPVVAFRNNSELSEMIELNGGKLIGKYQATALADGIAEAANERLENDFFCQAAQAMQQTRHDLVPNQQILADTIGAATACRPARVIVLFVMYPQGPRYNKQKRIEALKRLVRRFHVPPHIVYVDNAAALPYERRLSEREFEISGDNRQREFSGWQRALDFVQAERLPGTVFLFVNDAFVFDSLSWRRAASQAAADCTLACCGMLGQRMTLPVGGELLGWEVMPYLRTHLFMAARPVIERLGLSLVMKERDIERIFLPRYHPDVPLFRPAAPITAELRAFIFEHLTRTWHRRLSYTPDNFQALRGKAIAIVNSLLLTLKLHHLGHPLIPFFRARDLSFRAMSCETMNELWRASTVQAAPEHDLSAVVHHEPAGAAAEAPRTEVASTVIQTRRKKRPPAHF